MNTVTVWTAQYLLWLMVLGFLAAWLWRESRTGKIDLAVTAVLGLALALVFLYLAKSVHHDPRPFVQNPSITPLFGHSTDDGFPSDHSVAAGLLAVLALARHRFIGVLFLVCAILIAWARVAAHVHHLQDVVAGLLLGGLAAVIATVVVLALTVRATANPNSRLGELLRPHRLLG